VAAGVAAGRAVELAAERLLDAVTHHELEHREQRLRGERPEALEYDGNARDLQTVWIALRSSVRGVLENVTLADIAEKNLPWRIDAILNDPEAWIKR
jgi:DNA-binding IscR family transcriptional regulator